MKVLWFEVTPPGKYLGESMVIGGWQDSLERVLCKCSEVELTVCFEVYEPSDIKVIDRVTYIPMYIAYNSREKKLSRQTWEVNAQKLISAMKKVVAELQPDIIHVFGTEWPYGLIAEHTDIPVVIHIQGAIVPYNNAMYPPKYGLFDVLHEIGIAHPIRIRKAWHEYKFDCSRQQIEQRIWKSVSNYMGRTNWDQALSEMMHPGRTYFHVEEALRSEFTMGQSSWEMPQEQKVTLISTGCSTFWKGPDMLLKTAHVLKEYGLNFEWKVAGCMRESVKRIVEMKESKRFEDNNITFLGFINPQVLKEHLLSSTMYIHTAYIENSPNSICEAQCLGIPIVSTNVGGISTLIKNGEQGDLVPANDPWQMAYAIIMLSKDKDRMLRYSQNSKAVAMKRHDDANIRNQLLNVYHTLLKD